MNAATPFLLAAWVCLAAAPPDLGPGHTFTPRASWTDTLGQTHIRYQHRFQGLRVWGSEVVDHLGPRAAPPTLALAVPHLLTPKLQAFAAGAPVLGEPILWPEYVDVPAESGADAVLVDHDVVGYRNALYLKAAPNAQEPGEDAWDFIVDADTFEVLEEIPVDLPDTPATGAGNSLYRGRVLLNTTSTGSGYVLVDTTRGKGGPVGSNVVGDGQYQDGPVLAYASSTNVWGDGKPEAPGVNTASPNGQTMAVDIAAGIQSAWDYFKAIHGRLGPDGKGTAILGIAHGVSGTKTDNAYWTTGGANRFAVIRPATFLPLTTLPILAHEFTHGVTEYSAGLVYAGESGALNEATSDFFGAMADAWVRNGAGAFIGDLGTDWSTTYFRNRTGNTRVPFLIRNYIKPSSAPIPSPDAWSPTLKNLDVHRSSGPMNRAFYFLSAGVSADASSAASSSFLPGGMAGIGNDKAARIWYRALTTYLTSTSGYAEARSASLRAAVDLFGAGSPEAGAVAGAFAAINVGKASAATPPIPTTLTATAAVQGSQVVLSATSPSALRDVLFYVDRLFAGSASQPPYTLTLDASRTLANGTHTLSARAFSAAGLVATAPDVTFTLSNTRQQILVNPGFEGALMGWTGDTAALGVDFTGGFPHAGYAWAKFDGASGPSKLTLSQQVGIPAGSVAATLSYWLRVEGGAVGSADTLTVNVTAGDASPVTVGAFTQADPKGVWIQKKADLSAYAGQTVQVSFQSAVNPAGGTSFNVDDVRLVCSESPQTEITLNPDHLEVYAGNLRSVAFAAQVSGPPAAGLAWTAAGGGVVDGTGVYTPSSAPGVGFVQVQSPADPGAFAQAPVRVKPLISLQPATAVLTPGATLILALDAAPGVAPALSATGGGANPGTFLLQGNPPQVLYTAPANPGTFTLEARDPATGARAASTLTVLPAPVLVTLAPAQVSLAAGAGVQFTATVQGDPAGAVAWAIQEGSGGGLLTPAGLYAAPLAPGTYHVSATSVLDPTRSAVATITVQGGVTIDPPQATVLTGITQQFTASVPRFGDPTLQWNVVQGPAGGAIQGGTYTAPTTRGVFTIVASSASNPALASQAIVTVKTTDLNGNGITALDFADLAILADAWGALPALPAADLNGDGAVDDGDAALFFSRFGGAP